MENILKEALSLIKPTQKEEREKKLRIDDFMKRIDVPSAKIILGGSAKKNTWLKDSYDADIFVKFNYQKFKDRSDELSDITEKAIKKEFKEILRVHGSRDYFQIIEDDFVFEIIPILDIKDSGMAVNITDISPLHALWVKKHMIDPDQVRLAKAFAKSQGIYGAESFIQGFSGYCIEILIVHYGGFKKFLEAISKWKKRKVIDIMGYHNNIDIEVNQSKLESPLVLIDPVQKGRNVAAALSVENFKILISSAKKFLKSPGPKYFEPKIVTIQSIKEKFKKKNLHIITAAPDKGKDDIEGSKLLKCFRFLERSLINNDFTIKDKGWFWDRKNDALFWFTIKEDTLPKIKEWKGPPVEMKDFVSDFKKIYKETYVKDKTIYAKVERKYPSALALLKEILDDDYVKEKTKTIHYEESD